MHTMGVSTSARPGADHTAIELDRLISAGLAVGELRGAGREVDAEVLAHISPARSSVVNYYGSITVDYDSVCQQTTAFVWAMPSMA